MNTTSSISQAPAPAAAPTAAGAFCRISVAGPRTRVDLAVPSGVPLAALLPTLLRHSTSEGVGGAQQPQEPVQGGWVLSKVDGTPLDPASSLTASGVTEGELLVLHPARDRNPPPLYDDVVEVIGENSIHSGWGSRQTRLACGVVVVLTVIGAIAAAAATPGTLPGYLAGAAALLLLLGGGALSRAAGDIPAGTVVAALAMPAGAIAGTKLLGGPLGSGHLLLACAVVLLVAALGPAVVGGGDAVFAAFAVIGLLGGLGELIVVINAGSPSAAAATIAPIALAVTTMMPTLALRLSRLPRPQLPRTADELVDVPGQVELELVQQRVQRARQMLSGLVAGCHTVTAGSAALLATSGDTWAWVLAIVLVLLVLLRARLFREVPQVAAPVVATLVALAVGTAISVAQLAGDTAMLLGMLAPILLGAAVIAGMVGLNAGRKQGNPRNARLLDVLETMLLLSVVPLALAVWGIYRILLDLGA